LVSLALITMILRTRKEEEEKRSKRKSSKEHKSLSSHKFEVGWLGVFIAPTTKMPVGEGFCRMTHRTVRCVTRHCPVCQPRHPTVRVRPLELLTCGPLDSPVVHRTGPVHCSVRHLTPALTLRAQLALFTVHYSCCRRPLAQVAVAPLGTPDSPVLHRTVQ
jgi:hypothetical protein